MYCFLCDRPAKGRMMVDPIFRDRPVAGRKVETLDVCEDCARRVRLIRYEETTREYIVFMRSLT